MTYIVDPRKKPISLQSWADMERELEEERQFQATLHPSDPRHKEMFSFDDQLGYLDVYWGGYEYSYELSRIESPFGLLAFLDHVLAKGWRHATGRRVGYLIRAISARRGWRIHELQHMELPPLPLPKRTTPDAEERGKLTPKLRYDVLLRDNFRCRACGFGTESGAHLHIDHIKPISAGGRTEFNNLQALCSVCNQGKGARR